MCAAFLLLAQNFAPAPKLGSDQFVREAIKKFVFSFGVLRLPYFFDNCKNLWDCSQNFVPQFLKMCGYHLQNVHHNTQKYLSLEKLGNVTQLLRAAC